MSGQKFTREETAGSESYSYAVRTNITPKQEPSEDETLTTQESQKAIEWARGKGVTIKDEFANPAHWWNHRKNYDLFEYKNGEWSIRQLWEPDGTFEDYEGVLRALSGINMKQRLAWEMFVAEKRIERPDMVLDHIETEMAPNHIDVTDRLFGKHHAPVKLPL